MKFITYKETIYGQRKLIKIKELIDGIISEGNEPTDEELDFDDDAIEMYAEMHNLKEAMEKNGF